MFRTRNLIAAACLAGAALPAVAQNLHVNDAAYVGIARCQGLIDSNDLQPQVDPTGINRFMDLQKAGRTSNVLDRADARRTDALRSAATANPDQKASLIAERDGVCAHWADIGANAPHSSLTGGN
jgi:hypothetical protein